MGHLGLVAALGEVDCPKPAGLILAGLTLDDLILTGLTLDGMILTGLTLAGPTLAGLAVVAPGWLLTARAHLLPIRSKCHV